MNVNQELVAKVVISLLGFFFGYKVLNILKEKTTNRNEYHLQLDNVTVNVNTCDSNEDENDN